MDNLNTSKFDNSKLYAGVASAAPSLSDPTLIGTTVNIGKPIRSAIAIHHGANAQLTNIVVDSSRSDPRAGFVSFKAAYTTDNVAISIFYIIIAE